MNWMGMDKYQEFQVLQYLAHVCTKMEEIDEEKMMDLIDQYNLIWKAVDHVSIVARFCSFEYLASFFKFLDSCFDSEAYVADKDRFVTPSLKKVCLYFSENFLERTLGGEFLMSKDVKSLKAEIRCWKREE